MKKKGSFKIILIGFILGTALLLIGGFAFGDKENGDVSDNSATPSSQSLDEYKAQILNEIESICLGVDGVHSVKAAVYFEGGGESMYAQNTQFGSSEKSEYVIIGSGSGAHALYIGESLPPLSGIGVVCDTGGSDNLKNEIAALLAATYGLPLTRIYVSEGQG
jgi:hypothetical protein